MKKTILFILLSLILFSCSYNEETYTQEKNKQYDIFEQLMTELTLKYQNLPAKNSDTLEYKNIYELTKQVYFPHIINYKEFNNDLFFELREYTACGGCWTFKIIYIYNDSLNFILPLTDYYIYWRQSSDVPLSDNELKYELCFETELNNLLKTLEVKDWSIVYRIIDAIMYDMLNYNQVSQFDIPKFNEIAQYVLKDNFFNDSCKNKIINNIDKIQTELNRKMIYSNGLLTYMIKLPNYNDTVFNISIEVLNNECYSMIII